MAKKLVKVCLHSSKAVQISLQFDEFFLTKKFHSNYTNFSKTLTLYSWTKSSFESFFIALQLLRHPTRDRQDIIKNLGLIGESQLSCGLFFARLLLIKRDNFFQHCLHHCIHFRRPNRNDRKLGYVAFDGLTRTLRISWRPNMSRRFPRRPHHWRRRGRGHTHSLGQFILWFCLPLPQLW